MTFRSFVAVVVLCCFGGGEGVFAGSLRDEAIDKVNEWLRDKGIEKTVDKLFRNESIDDVLKIVLKCHDKGVLAPECIMSALVTAGKKLNEGEDKDLKRIEQLVKTDMFCERFVAATFPLWSATVTHLKPLKAENDTFVEWAAKGKRECDAWDAKVKAFNQDVHAAMQENNEHTAAHKAAYDQYITEFNKAKARREWCRTGGGDIYKVDYWDNVCKSINRAWAKKKAGFDAADAQVPTAEAILARHGLSRTDFEAQPQALLADSGRLTAAMDKYDNTLRSHADEIEFAFNGGYVLHECIARFEHHNRQSFPDGQGRRITAAEWRKKFNAVNENAFDDVQFLYKKLNNLPERKYRGPKPQGPTLQQGPPQP